MSSEVGTNDPSKLRIRNPSECDKKRQEFLQARVPEGWVIGRSTTTGECFYYNTKTKISQWTFPTSGVSQAAAATAATAKIHNTLSTGTNSSSNLTGGSRKYKKRKHKKSKTIKRRK
jgi:hypothetical protein